MSFGKLFTTATTLALFSFGVLALDLSQAQEPKKFTPDDLPKAVKKVVKDKYPQAKIKNALKEKDDEGDTIYEVETILNGKTLDLMITPSGEIDVTELEIDIDDLPKPVAKTVAAKYPKAKIEKAEKITDEDAKVTFEVILAVKGEKSFEVVLTPAGKIVEPSKAKEKDDDKEESDAKVKKKTKD